MSLQVSQIASIRRPPWKRAMLLKMENKVFYLCIHARQFVHLNTEGLGNLQPEPIISKSAFLEIKMLLRAIARERKKRLVR